MILKDKLELEALHNRKEFCFKSISNYNKKLPKKLLTALFIGIIYAAVRINIDKEEKISFYNSLGLIVLFCFIVIIFDHIRLIKRIKKDIKELDAQIKVLESKI